MKTIQISEKAYFVLKMGANIHDTTVPKYLDRVTRSLTQQLGIQKQVAELYPTPAGGLPEDIAEAKDIVDAISMPVDFSSVDHPWFPDVDLPEFDSTIKKLTPIQFEQIIANLQYYTTARQVKIRIAYYKLTGKKVELVKYEKKR